MLKIKKNLTISNVDKELELSYTAGRNVNSTTALENSLEITTKTEYRHSVWISDSTEQKYIYKQKKKKPGKNPNIHQ